MYTLENDNLRITVRKLGAEMASVFNKKTNIEHLWQANPGIWGWHAPVLFPVVGRCLDDQITIAGQSYHMEKHGFARKAMFDSDLKDNGRLEFTLSSSESTLAIYPYQFDFHINYQLTETGLVQTFEVVNKGNETMYFSLGGHPAFAVPFMPGEVYEDYYVEFDRDTKLDRWHIDGEGFFDGRKTAVLDDSHKLRLDPKMFTDDAYIFKGLKSRKVIIKTDMNPHTLSVEFPDFDYLGLWAKVNASYICIEPWLGCADTAGQPTSFDHKEGIRSLPPLGKFQASIIITVS